MLYDAILIWMILGPVGLALGSLNDPWARTFLVSISALDFAFVLFIATLIGPVVMACVILDYLDVKPPG
jgi:hypothetical protein